MGPQVLVELEEPVNLLWHKLCDEDFHVHCILNSMYSAFRGGVSVWVGGLSLLLICHVCVEHPRCTPNCSTDTSTRAHTHPRREHRARLQSAPAGCPHTLAQADL